MHGATLFNGSVLVVESNVYKSMHWLSWDKLCRSKKEGGLGFCSLGSFNQALLSKQAWRLIENPYSLASRVLMAKYYTRSTFLKVKSAPNSSFIWKSILWVGNRLKKECDGGLEVELKCPSMMIVEHG